MLMIYNRDREKIKQTFSRTQLHCTTLLAFKYAENLACILSYDLKPCQKCSLQITVNVL